MGQKDCGWDTYNILPSGFTYNGRTKKRIREVVAPLEQVHSDYEPVVLHELDYAYRHSYAKAYQSIFEVYMAELLCMKKSHLVSKYMGGTFIHTKYEVTDRKNIRRTLVPLSRMAFCE